MATKHFIVPPLGSIATSDPVALYGSFSLFLEDLSILLHLLIFLMNDSQTYKNSYEVSIVCKSQFVSKNVLQYFALTAVDSSS